MSFSKSTRLKYIGFAIFFIFGFNPLLLASKGSLLILKTANLYEFPDLTGKHLKTKLKLAYEINNIQLDAQQNPVFQIIYYGRKSELIGSGYILETDEELKIADADQVRVYGSLPQPGKEFTKYTLIATTDLQFTGRKEVTPKFPNIEWRSVDFKTKIPRLFWVKLVEGIYRQDKTALWLNQIYPKVSRLRLKASSKLKILKGLIEVGFSDVQVRLALGEPTQIKISDSEEEVDWMYVGKRIVFENKKVKQIL